MVENHPDSSFLERRAAKRRMKYRKQSREQQHAEDFQDAAVDGLDDTHTSGVQSSGRSLNAVAAAQTKAAKRAGLVAPRWPRLGLYGAAAVCLSAVFTGISTLLFGDGPVLGSSSVGWLSSASAVALASGYFWLRWAQHVAYQHVRVCAAVSCAVMFVGLVGFVAQDSIDGVPVYSRSSEASAAAQVRQLQGDLDDLVAADELLALPIDQLRVRVDDLGDARADLLKIVQNRSGVDAANISIAEASRAVVVAADAGAQALLAKSDVAAQFDQARNDQADGLREVMVVEALRAGQLIRSGAEQSGVGDLVVAPVRE